MTSSQLNNKVQAKLVEFKSQTFRDAYSMTENIDITVAGDKVTT
jgi:hypothetical protein